MAFMNKIRSLPLPPVKNVLNVAMQTAKQNLPGQNKREYEQPHGPPQVPPRPQSVRFADQEGTLLRQTIYIALKIDQYSRCPNGNSRVESVWQPK